MSQTPRNPTGHTDDLDYARVSTALARLGVTATAAESHGLLCGVLCARGTQVDEGCWLQETARASQPRSFSADDLQVLRAVREETVRRFEAGAFEFQPLLPGDSRPITDRASALGEWCDGFLYGLGVGGIGPGTDLSDDARDVMDDLAAISQVDAHAEESEESEGAFAEVVEYLRAGVMLLREELAPPAGGQGGLEARH